jgi:pimeloyl-ACP methyl ester carboxylesterase
VGASFGAPFAIYAASESPDIRGLVLVHGFGEIESVLKHRLTQIWKKHIYFFSNLAAAIAAKIIVYWVNPPEPVEYARKLRPDQLVLLIESKTDSFVPMTSRIALEHALKQSPAIIKTFKTDGDHLHPSAKNLIQNIIDLTVDFFKKQSWF